MIGHAAKVLHRAFLRMPMALSLGLIVTLPFGYYPDYPDSARFEIGFGGGFGQVATIIRDCEGNPLSSRTDPYQDFGGVAAWRLVVTDQAAVTLGLRAGKGRVKVSSHGLYYGQDHPWVTYSYYNPYVSFEAENAGFGIGYVEGPLPYKEGINGCLSGHLRLGSTGRTHFYTSFAENVPLVSAGGYWDIGMGGPAGERVYLFMGLSVAPYDQPGYVQQTRVRLYRGLDADLSFRLGKAESVFEGSLALGLSYRFGSQRKTPRTTGEPEL